MAALFAVMEFLCTCPDPQYRDMWIAPVTKKSAGACDVCSSVHLVRQLSIISPTIDPPDQRTWFVEGRATFYVI